MASDNLSKMKDCDGVVMDGHSAWREHGNGRWEEKGIVQSKGHFIIFIKW